MRKVKLLSVLLLQALVLGLLAVLPVSTASAAASLPTLQFSPVDASSYDSSVVASNGDFTTNCASYSWIPTTYDFTGTVQRTIPDDKSCWQRIAAGKSNTLYASDGVTLQSFVGATARWKYPLVCNARPTVGANNNVYTAAPNNRIIGLTPTVASGTALPQKILDIANPYTDKGCSVMIVAFKDGFAVTTAYTAADYRATFYRYNGTKLVEKVGFRQELTSPDFEINASGVLFYPTYSNSYKDYSVSAYDPFTKTVKWTKSVYTHAADPLNAQPPKSTTGGAGSKHPHCARPDGSGAVDENSAHQG
jgi:hypothetical protein